MNVRQKFNSRANRGKEHNELSDADLVKAAAAGDKAAFVTIVGRYQVMICAITLAVTSDFATSKDAAQETFLIAWRNLGTLREADKFKPWLCQIARRTAVSQSIQDNRQKPLEAADFEPIDPSALPDERACSRDEEALVETALKAIAESYRVPLVMYYFEGESVRAVAESLGITEGAVKQRLARGRDMLREELSDIVGRTLARSAPKNSFVVAIASAIGALESSSAISERIFAAATGPQPANLVVSAARGWRAATPILLGGIFALIIALSSRKGAEKELESLPGGRQAGAVVKRSSNDEAARMNVQGERDRVLPASRGNFASANKIFSTAATAMQDWKRGEFSMLGSSPNHLGEQYERSVAYFQSAFYPSAFTSFMGETALNDNAQGAMIRPLTLTENDTDQDGLPDLWEMENFGHLERDGGTDSDGDGLFEAGELSHGTNPNNPDTDGDGMPDGWESRFSLSPTDSMDGAGDPDGDGFASFQEFIAGTDPQKANSHLRITEAKREGELFSVTVHGWAGSSFSLERKDFLGSGEWREVPAISERSRDEHSISILTPIETAAGFYRVQARLESESHLPTPQLQRSIPIPLPEHPGNIFLRGEELEVAAPADWSGSIQLYGYEERVLAEVEIREGRIDLGELPIGFYRLHPISSPATWKSVAVIEGLRAPTPLTSPVGVDAAMAWFFSQEQMQAAARLCALAGVNYVRDRMSWGEIAPDRDRYADQTRYDLAVHAQAAEGLQVLQVNHFSPSWAGFPAVRFPRDLRDVNSFHRILAARWKNRVAALEMWNEPDIPAFGGHTGAEIASLQKAAFLGAKRGNPEVIGSLSPFALPNQAQLEDLHANETWTYFDTFNFHHYGAVDSFPALYATFRKYSAGRPVWVTEFAHPVSWTGDPALKEPSFQEQRVQAERVAKTYASSLHEGSSASFYFLLPHHAEGSTQYGLLREDLTPRPAYVALAALGRLLADAKPLGRYESANANLRALAFTSKPDGVPSIVIVGWSAGPDIIHQFPLQPREIFDHLGRVETGTNIGQAPKYFVFSPDAARQLPLSQPPAGPMRASGRRSTVVFQALWPQTEVDLTQSAYRIGGNEPTILPIYAYNFASNANHGTLEVTAPEGWDVSLTATNIQLAPMERRKLELTMQGEVRATTASAVRIRGRFDDGSMPTLSLRLVEEVSPGSAEALNDLPGANIVNRWHPDLSGDGQITLKLSPEGVRVDSRPLGSDRWVYPRFNLFTSERASADAEALVFQFSRIQGSGTFRVLFTEANGAAYVVDFHRPPPLGETALAMVLFQDAIHGTGWSAADPNGRLDPGQIVTIQIGCNTSNDHVVFALRNLRWVKLQ